MIWLIASLLYALVGVLIGCRVASIQAWRMLRVNHQKYRSLYSRQTEPDGEQWTGAGMIGLMAASLWPLVLCAFLARGWLFAPPRDVQIKRQEERIAELERELEIGR